MRAHVRNVKRDRNCVQQIDQARTKFDIHFSLLYSSSALSPERKEPFHDIRKPV